MELVEIGKILKPQGIKGELKFKPLIGSFLNDVLVEECYIDGKVCDVVSLVIRFGYGYIKLKGMENRNQAELMRGKTIKVDKNVFSNKIFEGSYLISDLVGLIVECESGEKIGKIVKVLQYGSADVFSVKEDLNKSTFEIPFLDSIVKSVDIEHSKIVVDKKEYENFKM